MPGNDEDSNYVFVTGFDDSKSYADLPEDVLEEKSKTDPRATYHLGLRAWTKKDEKTAYHYLKESAEKLYAPAEYLTSYFLFKGIGVTQNSDHSFIYLNRAASHGHPDAQYHLGKFFLEKKENILALENFMSAAAGGNKDAQKYIFETAIHEFPYRAVELLEAIKQNLEARHMLGIHYHNGDGVNKDSAKAIHLLATSTDEGKKLLESNSLKFDKKQSATKLDETQIIEVIEGMQEGGRIKNNSSHFIGHLVAHSKDQLTAESLKQIHSALAQKTDAKNSGSCKMIRDIISEKVSETAPKTGVVLRETSRAKDAEKKPLTPGRHS